MYGQSPIGGQRVEQTLPRPAPLGLGQKIEQGRIAVGSELTKQGLHLPLPFARRTIEAEDHAPQRIDLRKVGQDLVHDDGSVRAPTAHVVEPGHHRLHEGEISALEF
jgi:hypothetical protein